MSKPKSDDKQYGLLLPKKQLAHAMPSNVFGDENASDEEEGTDWVKKALKAENEKNKIKKQTKLNMQKALNEDPTIYQYDEVYDDMERTKAEQKAVKVEVKKPKYIGNLLKAAERRKREQEHRIERMVQKEREAEGAMFADKESFVTSGYKAKLEEFKKLEEEEARMERLEAIGDVTKQQDMSGFYRHLFHQTVDNNEESTSAMNASNNDNSEAAETTEISQKNASSSKVKKTRQYRQRQVEEGSDSESDTNKNEVEDKSANIEPEIREDESVEPEKKKSKLTEDSPEEDDKKIIEEEKEIKSDKVKQPVSAYDDKSKDTSTVNEKPATKPVEIKKKISIWEKRTVGPVFEAALQRYYERKAMRMASV